MVFNIILEGKKRTYNEMYEKLGEPIHKLLAGNKDYVDSNIVLNFDNEKNTPTCNLIFDVDACEDKEFVRENLKKSIDLFIDNL